MGEAKRRKALGLMPTVHAFEAQLDGAGQVSLIRGPEDGRLQGLIVKALADTQLFGAAWESEFRSAQVLAGQVGRVLSTPEDVQGIPVAPLRRITGELVLGQSAPETDDVLLTVEGGKVRLREQRHSFDGQRWESMGGPRDPQRLISALQEHPAFRLEGEVIGQVQAEHWLEGRIDLEPEPPEELLDTTETVVREWHGETPDEWAELHHELGGEEGVPLARRTVFELRRPAPLQSPLSRVFAIRQDVEFFPMQEGSAYTLDGETWVAYDPDAELPGTGGLPADLAQFFDLETVPVTVYADGRIEWDEGAVPEEQAGRVRADLRESTGAGDPAAWQTWTQTMLRETFGDELNVPEDRPLPVPVAVRLDISADAIDDPDPLAQTFMESEVSFDGEQWRDLFGEELPEELQDFARNDLN
ncbi:hypothetical protein [Deinococcus koreensis]|uniref:Uncharacterized protein n=1 Tax=Deinococcus koreensis TaxID=2054903 RepID=A0A2K3V1P1_9DEIO|nr:hypothetical protein [Deinococcus koreensis]PNY82691.1 hypothetical protein CVO96_16220 [Deinococcus koreensis]